MKKLTVFCSALFALSVSAELLAQTRGPRYNPPSGGGGSSRSSGGPSSSSRGPSYNPPSRSSSGSSSSRGPSYNPPSRSSSGSSSSRGPSYSPPSRSSSGSSSSRGPSYNPPSSSGSSSGSTHTGPSYNPPRNASYHGSRPVIVGPRYHNPFPNPPGINRYPSPRDYYTTVDRTHIYRHWVLVPVVFTYGNGYWDIGGYPWYVYNGYRHRYDPVETCKYQLVDGNDYTIVKDFGEKECKTAYDECAVERDTLNRPISVERYFCAEAVDEDQANANTEEYSPMPNAMTPAKLETIKNYLNQNSLSDIWKDGYNGGVGKCLIYKLSGNQYDCKWIVTVGDEYYPDKEGSICSKTAQPIGCTGDEKDVAGCILQKAIQEGYCH